MLNVAEQRAVVTEIAAFTGIDCSGCEWQGVAGGDINQAWKLVTRDGHAWFLKLNQPAFAEYFAAEHDGLCELKRAADIRVPEPTGHGVTDMHAWLLLEWLDLTPPDAAADERCGYALANMHRITADRFGWHRDNVIGATLQSNKQSDDWVNFYRDERLAPQLALAGRNGVPAGVLKLATRLLDNLDAFFVAYEPCPSLLHGDLWGGNRSALVDGTPVLFDPATYFGDREADLAMTRLFGGFGADFYTAYNAAWPLQPGFEERQDLYNLYHILNHFNLFGAGYQARTESLLQRLVDHLERV